MNIRKHTDSGDLLFHNMGTTSNQGESPGGQTPADRGLTERDTAIVPGAAESTDFDRVSAGVSTDASDWLSTAMTAIVGTALALGFGWQAWQNTLPFDRLPHRPAESAEEKYREAAAVFSGRMPVVDHREMDEIETLLEEFHLAQNRADSRALVGLFDCQRFFQEVDRMPACDNFTNRYKRAILDVIRDQLGEGIAQDWRGSNLERFEVRHCRKLNRPDELLVYVRHWDDEGTAVKFRWSLVRRNGHWRIYDYENLFSGTRLSDSMAELLQFAMENESRLPQLQRESNSLGHAQLSVLEANETAATEALGQVDESALSPTQRAMFWMLTATTHVYAEEYQQALIACRSAEQLQHDFPALALIRAIAYNGLGRPSEARDQARQLITQLGPDAATYFQLGLAEAMLGNADQAVRTWRHGLADDPDFVDNLFMLGLSLPANEKPEVADWIGKLVHPERSLPYLAESFLIEDDWESFVVVTEALARYAAKHPLLSYYQAIAAADCQEAFRLYEAGAGECLQDDPLVEYPYSAVLTMYCYDQGLDAYKTIVPRRNVFADLTRLAFNDEDIRLLENLLTAHQRLDPQDATLPFAESQLAWLRDDWESVVSVLSEHRSSLLATGLDAWEIDNLWLRSLLRLERFDEALEVAQAARDEYGDPLFLALAYAARGQTSDARKCIDECLAYGYDRHELAQDEILHPNVDTNADVWKLFSKFAEAFENSEQLTE